MSKPSEILSPSLLITWHKKILLKYGNGENSEQKWNKDTVYALGLYKQLTSVLGFWPINKNKKSSNFKVGIITTVQLALVFIFVKNLVVLGNCGSSTELVDILSLITTSSLAVIKVVLPWYQQVELYHIISSAIEDWSIAGPESHKKIMLNYAKLGRIVLIVQMFGAYMTIFPLIITRLPGFYVQELNNETLLLRNIPIGPRCWVSDMPRYLYLAYYCFMCFHLVILATAYLGCDVFLFGAVCHVCGQFELLYKSVEEINGNENNRQQRQLIIKFIKRHNHLLELASEFERAYNIIILFVVGANIFLISISGIALIWALRIFDVDAIFAMIVRVFVMLVQIFMYSYLGESLTNQAEKLQVAVYNTPWYKFSPEITRDMMYIMMRNNYPFNLTAGKIYNMNISNFKELAKSMFSYFSILRLMFD